MVSWEDISRLKHELQIVRDHIINKRQSDGSIIRINTCLEILEKWILREGE
jgi:hypothetical protein